MKTRVFVSALRWTNIAGNSVIFQSMSWCYSSNDLLIYKGLYMRSLKLPRELNLTLILNTVSPITLIYWIILSDWLVFWRPFIIYSIAILFIHDQKIFPTSCFKISDCRSVIDGDPFALNSVSVYFRSIPEKKSFHVIDRHSNLVIENNQTFFFWYIQPYITFYHQYSSINVLLFLTVLTCSLCHWNNWYQWLHLSYHNWEKTVLPVWSGTRASLWRRFQTYWYGTKTSNGH